MSNKKKKENNKKKKVSKEVEKMETWKCPKCGTISDTEKEKCTVCHEEGATEQSSSETEKASAETEQHSSEAEQQPSESEQQSNEVDQQPDETDQQPAEKEQLSSEAEQQSSKVDQQHDETDQQLAEKEQLSSESEQQSAEAKQPPAETEQQSDEAEQQPSEVEQPSGGTEQQPDETKQKADKEKQPPKKKEKLEKESSEEKSDSLMLKKVFVLGTVALIIFIIVMAIVIGRGSNDEAHVEEEVEVTEEVEEEELAEEPIEEDVEIPEGVLSNDYVVILQYKGLELFVREMPEITDDDVEFMIQAELRAQSTTEEVTDRPAEEGDTVLIDFAGSVDGEYFDGGTSEGFELELGSGMFIGPYGDYEGFEEQIIGHEIGDNFDITVQFPSAYEPAELAGEVANFNITIHGITETVTPELTDEWVQENSEGATTVEEYQEEIREMLYETTKVNILYMQQQEVFEALMEQVVVIEVPEWAIEEEGRKLKALFQNIAASEGMTLEEYLLAAVGMDEETFNIEVLRVAEELAPRMLAISLIIEYENIEPTQEEIISRTEVLARLNGMESAEEYIEVLGEEYVNETMILLSVTEFLIEHAAAID